MTLEQAIQNSDGYVYAGSQSGFFFIGTKDGIGDFEVIDRYYKHFFERSLAAAEQELKRAKTVYLSAVKEFNKSPLDDGLWAELEGSHDRLWKAEERQAQTQLENLSFTPILGREVIDVYDREGIEPYGKIVIVSGYEKGFAWFVEEYTDGFKKIKRSLRKH